MKTRFRTFAAIIIIGFVGMIACGKESDDSIEKSDLVGVWVRPVYATDTITFDRTESLLVDEYGIDIQLDKSIVERKNAGWCGTPPITYGDFKGYWSKEDSIVTISTTYWGGNQLYKWKLISVNQNSLKVKVILP